MASSPEAQVRIMVALGIYNSEHPLEGVSYGDLRNKLGLTNVFSMRVFRLAFNSLWHKGLIIVSRTPIDGRNSLNEHRGYSVYLAPAR